MFDMTNFWRTNNPTVNGANGKRRAKRKISIAIMILASQRYSGEMEKIYPPFHAPQNPNPKIIIAIAAKGAKIVETI